MCTTKPGTGPSAPGAACGTKVSSTDTRTSLAGEVDRQRTAQIERGSRETSCLLAHFTAGSAEIRSREFPASYGCRVSLREASGTPASISHDADSGDCLQPKRLAPINTIPTTTTLARSITPSMVARFPRAGRISVGRKNSVRGSRCPHFLRRWGSRRHREAVAMMQTTEDRGAHDSGSVWRPTWGQVSGAVRRLHPKTAVGPTVVVRNVVVEDALGVVLVPDDDVVEAVPAERTDHALAERVGLGCARRRGEESGAESADAAAKVGAVDRVAVVDEEARNLMSICRGLDDALRGPAGAGMVGNGGVDDLAAAKGEHDEHVEDAESGGQDEEEVAGPGFMQMVAYEGVPTLATLTIEAGWTVLGDGARGDLVAELGQFGGDDLLTPGGIVAPHSPDECAEICIDRGTTWRTTGAPAPEQAPRGAVPADNGVGFHEQDGVPQAPEAAGQCTEEPPIEVAPPRSCDLSAADDQLLAKDQVLGYQGCPGRDDGQDDVEQEAK